MADNPPRTILGSGLIALDLILSEQEVVPARVNILAGGSCGNVLTILAYFGWNSYPIAQLSDNPAAELLCQDLQRWGVHTDYLTASDQGITPIIIHRINQAKAKHQFEFKNPQTNAWLPRYKPTTQRYIKTLIDKLPPSTVFYFDRANSATITLAHACRKKGSFIVFEPSSMKDEILFKKALSVSHIVKFSQERLPNYQALFPFSEIPLEIQTLGNNGIMYRLMKSGESWHRIPAYSMNGVVDTAGAGDWCTAGIIHTLLTNSSSFEQLNCGDIEQAVKMGQSMGAINCCFLGARGSMYAMPAARLLELSSKLIKEQVVNIIDRKQIDESLTLTDGSNRSSLVGYEALLYR